MPTNFELKRLKPKLDIVEKPENRVHKLTDSNGARPATLARGAALGFKFISFGYTRAARATAHIKPLVAFGRFAASADLLAWVKTC